MPRILVADDLPCNVEFLEGELKTLGYEVVTAADGEEALRQVTRAHPDLILLDLSMPKMGGFEVLSILRKDPLYRGLPVILLTARKEFDDRVKGLDAGADDISPSPSTRERSRPESGLCSGFRISNARFWTGKNASLR